MGFEYVVKERDQVRMDRGLMLAGDMIAEVGMTAVAAEEGSRYFVRMD